MNIPQPGHMLPTPSSTVMQAPVGWTYIPVPNNHLPGGMFDVLGGTSQGNFPSNWEFPRTSQVTPDAGGVDQDIAIAGEQSLKSNSSSLQEDSLKKRSRRASKREADEEARRRENQGLRPYVVQVRPSGIIDSGCVGHLRWQEYVRNLTPRMLDRSVIKYEDQDQNSRDKLRDCLKAKFEFVDYDVTQFSFDTMIKTWLRRDRERTKRIHGRDDKPPGKLTDQQWHTLKQYWDSSEYKEKSDVMSERRKKVGFNPRLGRHGYAGQEARMVS